MGYVKDLGAVTAYAYAVEKGYTGTEEEFAELMASYADVAEDAAESAAAAEQAKEDALTAKTAAEAAAATATTKASAAATSADAASSSASTATTAATTATTKAGEATTAATTATTKATEAAASATTATTAASEAADSADAAAVSEEQAEEAADYIVTHAEKLDGIEEEIYKVYPTETVTGDIVSITDGADNIPVKSLTVAVEPVQDLHGQDSPYPAGGGKNKCPFVPSAVTHNGITFTPEDLGRVTAKGTASGSAFAATDAFEVQAGVNYTLSGAPSGGGISSYRLDIRDATSPNNLDTELSTVYEYGSGATFTPATTHNIRIGIRIANGYAIPSAGLVFSPMVRLSSVSDATYAPYSNICPITGWDAVNVVRCGKNLWNTNANALTVGTINGDTGADASSSNRVRNTEFIPFPFDSIVAAGYAITVPTGYNVAVRFYDSGKHFVYAGSTYSGWISGNIFDNAYIGKDVQYVKCVFRKSNDSAITVDDVVNAGIQLELGSTATAYEPYVGTTYPISLPSTVYGGTLDVASGVMTVDTEYVEVDLSTKTFTNLTSTKYAQTTIFPVNAKGGTSGNSNAKCVSSILPYNYNTEDTIHWYAGENSRQVRIYVPINMDVTGVTAQFCAELAEPYTITLDPVTISTLLGNNTIYADAGQVSVCYRADVGLYIDKRIAEVQALVLEA